MKRFIIFFLSLLIACSSYGQYINRDGYTIWTGRMGVGIPVTPAPNTSSHLQLGDSATNKALWLPRVQDTSAIIFPRQGMFVYSIHDSTIYWRRLHSWIKGGADFITPTLQNVTDAGALTTNAVTIKQKDSVGHRFSYAWSTNPLASSWTDQTPNTTLTYTSDGVTFSGGAFNLNNHVDQNFFVGVPHWHIHQRVVVLQKDGLSFGFGFRLTPISGNGQSYFAHFLLADTTGYIAFTAGNSLPDATSPNNRANMTFKWSVNDILDILIERQDRNAVITMTNLTTGLTSKLVYGPIFTGTCTMSVALYGGQWHFLNNIDFTYDEVKHPAIIGLGNSLMWGGNASSQANTFWSYITSSVAGGCINMGHPAEASVNGPQNLDDILNLLQANSSTTVLIELGVNDRNGNIPLDSFGARLRRTVAPIAATGASVVLINCVPQATGSVVQYNDTINAVKTDYGVHLADIYTALVGSGTTINATYAAGDGIHLNDNGELAAASIVLKQINLITYGSPLNVSPVPYSSDYVALLGQDKNNNLVKVIPGTANNYIKVVSGPGPLNVQIADFNISGKGFIGNELKVPGTGNLTSPNFSVNLEAFGDGYTRSILFTSQNLTTSSSTTTIDAGRLNFTTDPQINAVGSGLRFVHFNSINDYGIRFGDNGTGQAVSAASYNPIEVYRNNNAIHLFHINRGGGGEFDSTLVLKNIFTTSDTTTFKPAGIDASGNVYQMNYWPGSGGGGGGGGSVTSVSAALGMSFTTITTTGSVGVDTAVGTGVIMWPRLNKLKDSIISVLGGGGGTDWTVSGNASTTAGTNYIGTSDNVAFDFRTNATQAMRLNTAQELMIGSTTDAGAYKLQVTGDQIINGSLYINATANHIRLRNASNAAAAEFDISSADIGGSATPDLYIQDVAASLTSFVIMSGTSNIGIYGTTAFSAPTSTLQVFGSLSTAYAAKTGTYTATISDHTIDCTSGTFTVTLPTAASIIGREYIIKNSGAGVITVATTSSQNIDAATTYSLSAQYKYVVVQSTGSAWVIVANN